MAGGARHNVVVAALQKDSQRLLSLLGTARHDRHMRSVLRQLGVQLAVHVQGCGVQHRLRQFQACLDRPAQRVTEGQGLIITNSPVVAVLCSQAAKRAARMPLASPT